jgi:hypothetical protein
MSHSLANKAMTWFSDAVGMQCFLFVFVGLKSVLPGQSGRLLAFVHPHGLIQPFSFLMRFLVTWITSASM